MYRIIGTDGKEYGPVSEAQLREWIAQGRANADSQVSIEGATDWKRLGSFPEFSLLFPAVPTGILIDQSRLKNHPMAVGGMVMGILSLTLGLCCCYGLPFNILGLIFSIAALIQIQNRPDLYQGKGMAIAGLILSILSLLVGIGMFTIGMAAGWHDMTHEIYKL
jgi:hypothetical protein